MSSADGGCRSIVVVKLGGSVLSSARAYRRAAQFLRSRVRRAPQERFVAVVSAQSGSTDALERVARRVTSLPTPRALDLLWTTGEIRSVALLTLHLEALGVSAAGLNAHETGLRITSDSPAKSPEAVALHGERLQAALAGHSVVVVPGFFATNSAGAIVSLGRGGSDLTAVLLARGLGAARCELIKDVPGYFSADPRRNPAARQLPALTFSYALELADAGCDLVQRAAIEAAASAGLALVIRSLNERAPASVVSRGSTPAPAEKRIEFPELCCHPEPLRPWRTGDRSALRTA